MDTLYLRRFNSKTPLDDLIDEQGSLNSQETDYQHDLQQNFGELNYSACVRINKKIAILRAKRSYIERMIGVVKRTAAKPVFISHPDNYYADEL